MWVRLHIHYISVPRQSYWTQTNTQHQKPSMQTDNHPKHIQYMMFLWYTRLQCSWVTHRVTHAGSHRPHSSAHLLYIETRRVLFRNHNFCVVQTDWNKHSAVFNRHLIIIIVITIKEKMFTRKQNHFLNAVHNRNSERWKSLTCPSIFWNPAGWSPRKFDSQLEDAERRSSDGG